MADERRNFVQLTRYSSYVQFRVASYNVLAPSLANSELYPSVDPATLDWRRRKRTILREILHYNPCVIALQEMEACEVEGVASMASELQAEGHETKFLMRTAPGKSDGCFLAWKCDMWTLVEYVPVWYHLSSPRFMNRGNVGQIVLLRHTSGHHLLLANTHLLFNPRRGDIKLGQLFVLLHEALECRNRHSLRATEAPLLLVGDLNATPCSAVWDYLFSQREAGSLPLGGELPARAAGLLGAGCRLRMNVARDDAAARGSFLSGWFWRKGRQSAGRQLFVHGRPDAGSHRVDGDARCKEPPNPEVGGSDSDVPAFDDDNDDDSDGGGDSPEPVTAGPVPVSLPDRLRPPEALDTGNAHSPWPEHLTLTHPFGQLTSVYGLYGRGKGSHTGEPPCTTLHTEMQTCVDYMGMEKGLISIARLELPAAAVIHGKYREGGLPTEWNGSDHFPLVADFTWPDGRHSGRVTERGGRRRTRGHGRPRGADRSRGAGRPRGADRSRGAGRGEGKKAGFRSDSDDTRNIDRGRGREVRRDMRKKRRRSET